MKRHLPLLFLIALFGISRAELPPSAYEAKQQAATEALQIQVLKVEVEPGETDDTQKIEVLARVISVTRTSASVKPNDIITIQYTVTHHPAGWVGPGQVPILEEGKTMPAYLNVIPDTKNFCPAAGRMSFNTF